MIDWLIEPGALDLEELRAAGAITLDAARRRAAEYGLSLRDPEDPETWYARAGQLAMVRVAGPIMHGASPWAALWGINSPAVVAETLRAVAADDQAGAVLLEIDSPGGTVAGLAEMLEAARALAAAKPLYVLANEKAASVAYWLAIQGRELAATETATVGSIGGYSVLEDHTGRLEKLGIRMVPIATGERKLAGAMGPPVTEAHQADYRERLAAIYDRFATEVMVRRPQLDREAIDALEGGTYYGPEAVRLGLVDRVVTRAAYIDELTQRHADGGGPTTTTTMPPAPSGRAQTSERAMTTTMTLDQIRTSHPNLAAKLEATPIERLQAILAEDQEEETKPKGEGETEEEEESAETETEEEAEEDDETESGEDDEEEETEPQGRAATVAELAAAFPNARGFCFKCLEKGLTMAQAYQERNKTLEAENRRLKAGERAQAAGASTDPAQAKGAGSAGAGSTLEGQAAAIKAEAAGKGEQISDEQALARAARKFPELHEQYRRRRGAA